ncbi:metallophosphoesterase family protein [Lacticaseibacillus parakribbianus]|uniref:metallophosphoesterase family protein n=1 Tax=Lacticaseibacillus parakribbianus TaxID=2970927 RepID=UPI0021CB43FE|nr:metallophosphoesterase [Lacticaseibacillus parakribbianus]
MTDLFVLSDVHYDGTAPRTQALGASLDTIRRLNPAATVVIDGDLTNSGLAAEFAGLGDLLTQYSPLTFLLNLGNHDVRGPFSAGWQAAPDADPAHYHQVTVPSFAAIQRRVGSPIQTLYGAVDVGPWRVILLNLERGLKDAAALSDTQLAWLDAELEATALQPLVFIHQPLDHTHWRSDLYGGFGAFDAPLKRVLAAHPNTVLLSGHIHNGFGYTEVIPRTYATLVDLPALSVSELGYVGAGLGYRLTAVGAGLALAAWDFAAATRLAQFDQLVDWPTVGSLAQTATAVPAAVTAALNAAYDQTRLEELSTPPLALFGSPVQAQCHAWCQAQRDLNR